MTKRGSGCAATNERAHQTRFLFTDLRQLIGWKERIRRQTPSNAEAREGTRRRAEKSNRSHQRTHNDQEQRRRLRTADAQKTFAPLRASAALSAIKMFAFVVDSLRGRLLGERSVVPFRLERLQNQRLVDGLGVCLEHFDLSRVDQFHECVGERHHAQPA
jgi:hypothetical protein